MQKRDGYGMFFRILVVLVAAATGGIAQQGVVSPSGYENRWAETVYDGWTRAIGAANNRTLQIHTDVPALTISAVAWRPTPNFRSGAVTLDCEFFLGEGDYANRTPVFLSNFVGGPTQVVARRTVSWPAWVAPVPLPQDAFVLRLPLDRPWTYTRTRDLVWMIEVPTSSWFYSVDTAARLRDEVRAGIVHGTGCYNTWNNALAVASAESGASRSMQHRLSLWCEGLRPNSPTTILVGGTAVAQSYPFLCGYQYVSSVFLGIVRVADNAGAVSRIDLAAPYQSIAVGLPLHGQAFCLDDGRHPMLLPVTMTNGVEIRMPEAFPLWRPAYFASDGLSFARARGESGDVSIVTSFR